MLLRTGSAGSNTVADHVRVLTEAIRQIPDSFRAKIWIRIDGAGATHELVEHMKGLNTTRRTVRFTVGWKITGTDESAIAKLPATAWQAAVRQDGEVHPHAHVAELTGLDERAALWGVRLLVRRVRPSARDTAQLTDLENKTDGSTPSSPPTSDHVACAASPAATGSPSLTPSTVITPKSRTGCGRTRPWGCATCRPRCGMSTSAGS
ncbi:hypothetical protein [Nonomuraea sp. NPDC048826]|uniref:hypothetical protein n=1 Tax=Nonomuraea sp. NPDC048826 TaxID=3364347 RepID=UPI0037123C45